MHKRTSYEIKKKVLMVVKEKPSTYAQLERKVNTGYRSIKSNCEELQLYGQVKVVVKKHPANGRPSHMVSITESGLKTLKSKKQACD